MDLQQFISNLRRIQIPFQEKQFVMEQKSLLRNNLSKKNQGRGLYQDIMKLLCISLMGYEIDFAMMATIQMVTNKEFYKKKLGLLAISLLFNPKTEFVLMTNNILRTGVSTRNAILQKAYIQTISAVADSEMKRSATPILIQLLNTSPYEIQKDILILLCSFSLENRDIFASIGEYLLDYLSHHNLSKASICI